MTFGIRRIFAGRPSIMRWNRFVCTVGLVLIGSAGLVRGQDQPAVAPGALPEIRAGVCAFKAKDYPSAESHFQKALSTAPNEKRTYKLLALSQEMQYRKGDPSPANQAIGRRAIAAFARFLDAYPVERTAVMESAVLYKNIDAANLDQIVADEKLPRDVRAEILVLMSSDTSRCANKLFDANRQLVNQNGKETYRFKEPINRVDLDRANVCATRSVELANRALDLSTDKRSSLSELGSAYGALYMVADWKGDTAAAAGLKNKAKASYDKFSEEEKRLDALKNDSAKPADKDQITKAQMADAAEFVLTGTMVRRPTWEQLTEPVHPSYDEIFGPEPPAPKTSVSRAPMWKLFTSAEDGFSAMFPGGVIRDRGTGAVTYTSGKYLIAVMPRPSGQAASLDENATLAMTAWGSAQSTCNFVRMGGAECDVRLLGPKTIGGHPALIYRLDQVGCPTSPGVMVTVSTKDLIFVIFTGAGDENNADVKRFLASVKIN